MIETLSGTLVYLWEARGEVDQNEGRGGTRLLGWFESDKEAREAANGEGVMGTPGHVKPHQVLKQDLGNGKCAYYEIKKIEIEDTETIRKRGLAKLSYAEKKALGL